jgi:predicted DNA binding protein
MLTATLGVTYEGDWTANLCRVDVSGVFLASTFVGDEYLGLFSVETTELDRVVETIESHPSVESADIVEQYVDATDRHSVTLLIRETRANEPTPAQILHQAGYLPFGQTLLREGTEYFDLLLESHDQLSEVVGELEQCGSVSLEAVSQELNWEVVPSVGEWQQIFDVIPDRQLEVLDLAVERGYYKIPKGITLQELADEMDVTKTTASHQLRRAEGKIMRFFIPYLRLNWREEG